MKFTTLTLTLLGMVATAGTALANEQTGTSAYTASDKPQLVKKFRADTSRLPVELLLNKRTEKVAKDNAMLLVTPALSSSGALYLPNRQAGR